MRKMKDSGVAWIGEIPEEWGTLPLVRVIKERVSGNWGSEPTPTTDNIICIRVADFDFSKFSILDKNEYTQRGYKKNESLSMLTYGDILFEKSGGGQTTPVGRTIFFDKKMEATHSNFIDKLRVHDNYSNKFIFYYILVSYLTTYSNMYIKQTTGIQNFDLTNFLAKERICLPQLPEQHRIASYLDAKCAEIDRSMELVRQGIDKLKEYKKSVITEAVTKGLDPDLPMKDSGVPWIGEIPAEWIVSSVRWEFDNLDGRRKPISSENRVNIHGLYDYYGASGVIDKIDEYIFDEPLLLIGEDGANLALRNLPLIYVATGKYWVNNHAHILKPKSTNNLFYMAHQLECVDLFHYLTGSTQPKLTQANLSKIPVVCPPLREQHRIAAYLDAKCAEIDTLIAQKQALLDKLAEYKKSLIFECVTGKREVAA